MESKTPQEEWKAAQLQDLRPVDVDEVFLRLIEDGTVELSDDRFFELIRESPSWLGTKPFLTKIRQWQFMIGHPAFDRSEQNRAKKNLLKIGQMLAHEGQGRPEKKTDMYLYAKYMGLVESLKTFLDENSIEPTNTLPALIERYPVYAKYFSLKGGRRRHRSPREIVVRIVAKEENVSERTVYQAVAACRTASERTLSPRSKKVSM